MTFISIEKINNVVQQKGAANVTFGHKICYGASVDGIYAEWSWDGESLFIRNDRYGIYPLFYYQSKNVIIIASSIIQLIDLGAPIEFDDDAMAVFLRFGSFIGDDTPFKHIRSLPPGIQCRLKVGESFPRGLACTGNTGVAPGMNPAQVTDGFIDLFRQAIGRRNPNGRFALPLSGGQDSRHILFELVRQNYLPDYCCTAKYWPPSTSEDAIVAREICDVLHLKHIVVEQPLLRFQNETIKNESVNFCSDSMHGWFVPIAQLMNSSSVVAAYDGIAGDILSANPFSSSRIVTLYEGREYEELAEELLGNEGFIGDSLYKNFYIRWSKERAIAHIILELKKYETTNNPVNNFFFWTRTRKFAHQAMVGMLKKNITIFTPFLDHELFDFMISQPAQMFLDKQFHAKVLSVAYPQYKNIVFAVKRNEKWVSPLYFQRLAYDTIVKGLDKDNVIVNKSYVLKRMLRCLVDYRYMKNVNWLSPAFIYLNQLSQLTNRQNLRDD